MENRRHVDVEPMVANALTANAMATFYGAMVVDSGAGCTIRLRIGSVTGKTIKTIKLAAGQPYDGGPWDLAAIATPGGIYCQVVAGSLPTTDSVIYGEYT